MYERGADQSYWTPDYAVCYILAPFIGAFLAGNVFGYQKRLYLRIEHNLHESESEEETPASLRGKKTMKLHRILAMATQQSLAKQSDSRSNTNKSADNLQALATERSLLTQQSAI